MEVVLFFSTGRCGTHYLSKAIKREDAYVCHEVEFPSANRILATKYIPLARTYDYHIAETIWDNYKLPQMQMTLAKSGSSCYIDTGHQYNYGMWEVLLRKASPKVVRLRRDRYETALSFMTTEPSADIWNQSNYGGYFRWMMNPFFSICNTPREVLEAWSGLTRFQKVLWAIDEVERQWIRLKQAENINYIDYDFEDMVNGRRTPLEDFLDCKVIDSDEQNAKNSSAEKSRQKPAIALFQMQEEDSKLQELYRLCYPRYQNGSE